MCLGEHGSLSAEAALAGRREAAAFAEPGASLRFAPDLGALIHHIELRLEIDPAEGRIEAAATLTLEPTPARPTSARLQLDDLTIAEVLLDGAPCDWRHDEGVLTVEGMRGRAKLEVRYGGRPRRGLYFIAPDAARPERGHQLWSQCQDEDGHFLFPCVDHPQARQSFGVTVLAPAAYTVVGNGVAAGSRPSGERPGWTAWRWEQADPIPAYLFTVVVAELDVIEDRHGELALRYLVPVGTPESDVRRIFGRTPEMVALLERLTGTPFPWARYDQVVVEDFVFGGMENVAATTLTSLILTDPRAAMDYDGEPLIAHELGHQWFGDLVTCEDWSQAWLNEGWATACEGLWMEHSRGEAYAAWYRWSQAQRYFTESEGRYARPVISHDWRHPIDVFDRHLYEKGGCVLHTLRRELGDEVFFDGVRAYLAANRLKSVHTVDFRRALEQASGRSLGRAFHQWLRCPGFPDLLVKLSHEDGLLRVDVEQKQEGEGVPEAFHLSLRLEVVDGEGSREVTLPVRERRRSWAIPCAERPRRVRVDAGFNVLSRLSIEGPRAWLIDTLKRDDCPVLRIRAARALAKAAHPEGVAALIDAVHNDSAWYARAEYAGLLAGLGGASCRDALLSALAEEAAPRARPAVVQALKVFVGDPAVEAALAQVVAQGDVSVIAEGEAGAALGAMRSALAAESCEALLKREAWADALRLRGLAGLGASQEASALPRLLEHLGEAHAPRVRGAAAAALGQLIAEVPELPREALDALIRLARRGPFHARRSALGALGQAGDPRALSALREVHERAENGTLARAAFESARALRRTARGQLGLQDDLDALSRRFGDLRERVDRLEGGP